MAAEGFVQGLSGEEILYDVLDQVEKALRKDCNLRPTDSYGQGYSGKVEIHLKLIALDTTSVDVTAAVATSPALAASAEAAAKEAAENAGPKGAGDQQMNQTSTDVEVKETIEIPVEGDLNAVRERSDQPIPTASVGLEGEPVVRGRSYKKVVAGAEF